MDNLTKFETGVKMKTKYIIMGFNDSKDAISTVKYGNKKDSVFMFVHCESKEDVLNEAEYMIKENAEK